MCKFEFWLIDSIFRMLLSVGNVPVGFLIIFEISAVVFSTVATLTPSAP